MQENFTESKSCHVAESICEMWQFSVVFLLCVCSLIKDRFEHGLNSNWPDLLSLHIHSG